MNLLINRMTESRRRLKMKQRISITLDEKTLEMIKEVLEKNQNEFRNRSHAIEFIINKFLRLDERQSEERRK